MHFSFTIIGLVAAVASVSNAAVIPRANVNAGLAARYYANGVFPRESHPEVPGVARAVEDGVYARDFQEKRAGAPELATVDPREPIVKRSPQVVNRRLHARDFRVGRVTV
ncbi:hypothetical protein L208DRAFT_498652 [Tricholoma matsutake]|nr:hypothetical protein L208DRAFT_498652 [Tricholoma matsutake 945]